MPSFVQVVEDDRSVYGSRLFETGCQTADQPPLVTTDFVASDTGVSPTQFFKSIKLFRKLESQVHSLFSLSSALKWRHDQEGFVPIYFGDHAVCWIGFSWGGFQQHLVFDPFSV